jgi:hypothetical protein
MYQTAKTTVIISTDKVGTIVITAMELLLLKLMISEE